jgi:hypothetical protein
MPLQSNLPSPHPNQPSMSLQSLALHPLSDLQPEQPIKTKLFFKFPFFWVITLDHWVICVQSFKTMWWFQDVRHQSPCHVAPNPSRMETSTAPL